MCLMFIYNQFLLYLFHFVAFVYEKAYIKKDMKKMLIDVFCNTSKHKTQQEI